MSEQIDDRFLILASRNGGRALNPRATDLFAELHFAISHSFPMAIFCDRATRHWMDAQLLHDGGAMYGPRVWGRERDGEYQTTYLDVPIFVPEAGNR